MGALTSKKTQFNYRPWENKAIDSADSLDSFRAPIQVNVRGNDVLRVLPRLSTDKKFNWISDRTRFSIDGLTRQRIQTPLWRKHYEPYKYTTDYTMGHIKNTQSTKLCSVSWNFAFNLIKRHYTPSATAILGSTVDYPSIALTSNLFNNVGVDTGASRNPISSLRHLTPLRAEDPLSTDDRSSLPLSIRAGLLFMDLQKPPMINSRRVGYIIVNLNLRKFPLLELYIQQLSSITGFHQNSFYLFGNNFSMWDPITEPIGPISALPDYIAGKLKGVVQLQDFDTVVFLNGRYGEASDFLTADDLAKLLLDNDWGTKHERIYVFDLPNNHRDYALHYLSIRNSFFPRWRPEHLNFNDFYFMHEAPHVATAAYEEAMDDVEDTLYLDRDEKKMGITIRFSHPDWRTAPGVKPAYAQSTQAAHLRVAQTPHTRGAFGSLSSFKVSYGTHRSETTGQSDLTLPARTPFEGTTYYGIDCFGRIAKFAFCYPGPTYSKDSIDMFTELAEFLQIPLSFNTPSPLSFASVSSTPFFVETALPTFPSASDTYIYDNYRIDSITKASPMMALCSERLTPYDVNFGLTLSN